MGEFVDLIGSPQGRISSHLACFAVMRVRYRSQRRPECVYRVADRRVAGILTLGESMVQGNAERIFACTRT